jgi:hypothetical protein
VAVSVVAVGNDTRGSLDTPELFFKQLTYPSTLLLDALELISVLEGLEHFFPEACLLNPLCLHKLSSLPRTLADLYRTPTTSLVTALLTFPLPTL